MTPLPGRHGGPRIKSACCSGPQEKRRDWLMRHDIEPAAAPVLNDFQMLQSIWRHEAGMPRSTYVTPEERFAWSQLIKHLIKRTASPRD